MPTIQAIKKTAGEDVLLRMTPMFKKMSFADGQRDRLEKEVEGASERMMNHLLFGLRGQLSDNTFREVLDAMTAVLHEDKND